MTTADHLAMSVASSEAQVKRFPIPDLPVLEISYPRRRLQGGAMERDLHSGRQHVRLLDMGL